MSRINFQNRTEGHRVGAPSNRDLEQKLTYQQLLNLNHDLSKENQQLKNIASRLGQELRSLHTQFDIRPRDENNELYNAIGTHPILHQYELTLIPLLDAYEAKIQEFESGFETINEEFINLQKKYIEVSSENETLRTELTDKIKQLVEVYQSGSSEKLGADFAQIILAQINEKQKFLTEENSRLEREFQRYRSESDKYSKELAENKRREQEVSSRLKKLEIDYRQAEGELKSLKEQVFEGQMRKNDLESEKKKLENDLQRAMSQVAQLNKDRDGILRNYDTLKKSYERDVSQAQEMGGRRDDSWLKKPLEETKQQLGEDPHKKLAKIQKDYENVSRERNKLKDQFQQCKVNLDEANDRFAEIKKKIELVDNERRAIEMSEAKSKKLLEQFTQKSRYDLERAKRQNEEEVQRLEDDYYAKIEGKQKKIAEIEETLDKVKLERDKLEQENIIHTTLAKEGTKGGRSRDSERAIQKLKEKLAINDQLSKEQLQIVENDNVYLKRESQSYKNDYKDKNEELRRLRQELEKVKRELAEADERHQIIIDEIKRVKNEYEGSLRDKQRIFDQKIQEIKTVVEESERRRNSQREKVAESSREYKRVLEQIRNTFEERVKVLEGGENSGYNSKGKY